MVTLRSSINIGEKVGEWAYKQAIEKKKCMRHVWNYKNKKWFIQTYHQFIQIRTKSAVMSTTTWKTRINALMICVVLHCELVTVLVCRKGLRGWQAYLSVVTGQTSARTPEQPSANPWEGQLHPPTSHPSSFPLDIAKTTNYQLPAPRYCVILQWCLVWRLDWMENHGWYSER